ncbi:MAG: hypothetical protein JNM32_12015 [Dechloromonas sp.]|nr:hypothetical protein [Dechloromonas sp.]
MLAFGHGSKDNGGVEKAAAVMGLNGNKLFAASAVATGAYTLRAAAEPLIGVSGRKCPIGPIRPASESRMKNKFAFACTTLVVSLTAAGQACADVPDDTRGLRLEIHVLALRERSASETPAQILELARLPQEQRQQMRQQMREQWQQNPPDNWDGRHQPMPATPISQEERHRLREEMRGQQEPRGEGRGRRGGWH